MYIKYKTCAATLYFNKSILGAKPRSITDITSTPAKMLPKIQKLSLSFTIVPQLLSQKLWDRHASHTDGAMHHQEQFSLYTNVSLRAILANLVYIVPRKRYVQDPRLSSLLKITVKSY